MSPPVRWVSPFPPPLWGRVREGGGRIGTARVNPSPHPPPQGGRELTAIAATVVCSHARQMKMVGTLALCPPYAIAYHVRIRKSRNAWERQCPTTKAPLP